VEHEEFRQLVRMQLPQALFERPYLRVCGLDDELPFLVLFDTSLPPIDRRHRCKNIHTGSEPLRHERPRQRGRVGVGAEGGENDHGVEICARSQFFCCTHDRNALLWHTVRGSPRSRQPEGFRLPERRRTVKKPSSTRDSEGLQPRKRHRRTIQYLLLAVGCVLLIDALVGDKGLLAMMQARARYRDLEQSLATSRSDNARLREEARRLREDPTAIEEIARRELGLIRPGEKLFIIKDVESRDRR